MNNIKSMQDNINNIQKGIHKMEKGLAKMELLNDMQMDLLNKAQELLNQMVGGKE